VSNVSAHFRSLLFSWTASETRLKLQCFIAVKLFGVCGQPPNTLTRALYSLQASEPTCFYTQLLSEARQSIFITIIIITCQLFGNLGRKFSSSSGDDREGAFLFQRVSVLVQRFNAVLLHDSLPTPDCTD